VGLVAFWGAFTGSLWACERGWRGGGACSARRCLSRRGKVRDERGLEKSTTKNEQKKDTKKKRGWHYCAPTAHTRDATGAARTDRAAVGCCPRRAAQRTTGPCFRTVCTGRHRVGGGLRTALRSGSVSHLRPWFCLGSVSMMTPTSSNRSHTFAL
jgi:hypothetical protein